MIIFNTRHLFFLLLFTEFYLLSAISSVYLTKHIRSNKSNIYLN